MKNNLLYLLTLLLIGCFIPFLSSSANSSDVNKCRTQSPFWYACQEDKDCIIIYNYCGWPSETSNTNYTEDAKRCHRLIGAAMSCAEYNPEIMGMFKAECQNKVCIPVKISQ